jgi:hypothetical protein
MLIRLQLSFRNNLVFRGFLPETTEEGLHLSLAGGKYLAAIYMPDRKTQSGNVTDIPNSADELKSYVELFCRGLTMDVEVTRTDPEVTADLQAGRISEKTEEFGAELCEIVVDTYNRLVDYCCNIMREYWLEPLVRSPYAFSSSQLHLNGWRAVWLNESGLWQRLLVGKNVTRVIANLAGETDYLTREKWLAAKSFIEERKQAPMITILIANSFRHLDELNGRLAVVEAVSAIDTYITTYLPRLILSLPKFTERVVHQLREAQTLIDGERITEEHIRRFVETKGLRGTFDEILGFVTAEIGVALEDVKNAREAINERNLILHQAQRAIDIQTARTYVSAIDRLLLNFRQLIAK